MTGRKVSGAFLRALALFIALTLLIAGIGGRWYGKQLAGQQQLHAVKHLTSHAYTLASALNRRFALLEGLHAFAEATPADDLQWKFTTFAAGLYAGSRGIRNFAVAPGGVVRLVYPLKGNEKAVGHDLLHDPRTREDALRAMRGRTIVLSAPYELRQGGLGLVARTPFHSAGELQGLVTMVVDVPSIVAEAGLDRHDDYSVALRDRNGKVFFGNGAIFGQTPVVQRIDLPDGCWELAAVDKRGWSGAIRRELYFFYGLATFFAGVITLLVFRSLVRQQLLRVAVLDQTASLRESERYNRDLFDNSPIGLALCRMDGTLMDVNPAFARITGRSVEEALALTFWEITPERYAEQEWEQLELLEKNGRYGPYEKEYLHRDGHLVPVRLRGQLMERGGELLIWSSVEDVTEWRRYEDALQQAKDFAENLIRTANVMFVQLDNAGNVVRINEAAERITGYCLEEVTGRNWFELLVPRDRYPLVWQEFERITRYGEVMDIFENPILAKSGEERHIIWKNTQLRDGERTAGIISFGVDITERKFLEAALMERNEQFRLFVEHSPAAIAMLDRDMRYITASRRWLADYKLGDQDVAGRSHYELFPEIPERWRDIHRRCLAGAIEHEDEDPFVRADGSTDYIRWEIRPWYDSNGEVGGIIIFSEDITGRKRAEEELANYRAHLEELVTERTEALHGSQLALLNMVDDLNAKSAQLTAANEKLQEVDRLKSMFIASMSHELRTPLNSVIGYSSILMNEWLGDLTLEQKESLAIVMRAGKHLLSLINDVIDVSKIEAGLIEVLVEDFDLFDLVSEAAQQLETEIRGKGVAFRVENVHHAMRTDRRRLLQTTLNLLSNAMKYTETGEITLTASADGGEAVITVADTGIGIGEQDAKRLFRPFTRFDSHLRRTVQGTGLGLYLTHKLVTQFLKGTISYSSRSDGGSVFAIRVPVAGYDRTSPEEAR